MTITGRLAVAHFELEFIRKTLIDILTLRSDRLLTAHEHGLQGALF